ncbi:MAG: ankyrin repeat domain-containing protein [Burkholderiales bacterium]|nr:ankyrin repeat domain-containing protein [Burkholderiales bacterium]
MDFLKTRKLQEWALVGLVGIATIFALLPEEIADQWSINRTYIAAILGILLVIALFLYLKFAFFIMVALLVIGANVTDAWSETLGISKLPLIIALIAMVGISLINYVVSILPTGLEPKPREKSPEGVKAMFYAIEKDNLVYAQKVLAMNFDPNVLSDNGYTPLQYAAMRGNAQMVELFIRNGANIDILSKDGESAMELALKLGHSPAAEVLKRARQESLAQEAAAKEATA